MSKALYTRSRNSDSGSTNTTFRSHIPLSSALVIQYYQERAEEIESRRARKAKPKSRFEARRLGIAEDLREGMSYKAVMKKWGASRNLMADVETDMQVGKI